MVIDKHVSADRAPIGVIARAAFAQTRSREFNPKFALVGLALEIQLASWLPT